MGFLKAIPAGLYSLGLRVRHMLYDMKILKAARFDIPVVCVGNITVGGTGKTPVTEFLVEKLSRDYTVAVLSRGYRRKTKGYLEVQANSSFLEVGDEPKQMKRKFPDKVVVVCEKRAVGIRRIRDEHPEVDLIIMDDGFQHRRVEPKVNIVLTDYTRPIYEDHLLPWGNLRDIPSQMSRANIVMVTKTPATISPIERRLAVKSMRLYPYQALFFTSMKQGALVPLFPEAAPANPIGKNVVALAGIGNPASFVDSLREKYNVLETYLFRDHYVYKVRDLKTIEEQIASLPSDTIIITTEKDGVKLANRKKVPEAIQQRLYVLPVRLHFPEGDEDKFIKTVYKDANEN